jgi:hypothetical protein
MSVLNGPERPEYEKFNTMSTEALEDILRQDFELPDDADSDMGAILYITQLIADREREQPTGRVGDVQASWADFQKKYLSSPGEISTSSATDKPRHRKKVVRLALIAAAAIVLLVGTAYAAGALGWIPGWDKDYFWYTPDGEIVSQDLLNAQEYNSLEEALAAYGAPENMVPSYIPDGYVAGMLECNIIPEFTATFIQEYTNTEGSVVLYYSLKLSDSPTQHSKDEDIPEIYTIHGIDFYIMTNAGKFKAIWNYGDFECSISGLNSKDDLIKMIDSMYTE